MHEGESLFAESLGVLGDLGLEFAPVLKKNVLLCETVDLVEKHAGVEVEEAVGGRGDAAGELGEVVELLSVSAAGRV